MSTPLCPRFYDSLYGYQCVLKSLLVLRFRSQEWRSEPVPTSRVWVSVNNSDIYIVQMTSSSFLFFCMFKGSEDLKKLVLEFYSSPSLIILIFINDNSIYRNYNNTMKEFFF